MRHLVLVLGDQLDHHSAAFDDFDRQVDSVWMAEVAEEVTHVPCHQLRIVFFLAAMRQFRDELRRRNSAVEYHELQPSPADERGVSFGEVLAKDIRRLQPERLIVTEPGDVRVLRQLQQTALDCGIDLEIRPDRHFYCSTEEFREYAAGKKKLLMEFFYRSQRKKHNVLMDGGQPVGGQWNFDADNRQSFGRQGPDSIPPRKTFRPNAVTKGVIGLVQQRFADHPGQADAFSMPVSRRQALAVLRDFVEHRLPQFGPFEDAMWTDEPFLYHSWLSPLLNIRLLNPRECVNAAVEAWRSGAVPLSSAEGFVRQILGWREFIRGIYWQEMPEYIELNHLKHQRTLPEFFWNGETDMQCVRQSMQHVLKHGYAHHIHRLMVLGNFAQLWGVHPRLFHDWHMAMYVDAVDWVSLPNTLGMSQYGDGGIVGTKPYCSTGNYIHRMSNFCSGCRYDHRQRTGDDACPFTTLYWEFLDRHADLFEDNQRMTFAMRNLQKLQQKTDELDAIRKRAAELHAAWDEPSESAQDA